MRIFWAINGHRPCRACAPAAKRPRRKDAGSVRSRRLRTRLRTRRGGALQRPGACEMCGWGSSANRPFLGDDLGDDARTDGAAALADCEAETLVHRDPLAQL